MSYEEEDTYIHTQVPFITVVTDLGSASTLWFHKGVDKCVVPGMYPPPHMTCVSSSTYDMHVSSSQQGEALISTVAATN
jgi:hypothetical protein